MSAFTAAGASVLLSVDETEVGVRKLLKHNKRDAPTTFKNSRLSNRDFYYPFPFFSFSSLEAVFFHPFENST